MYSTVPLICEDCAIYSSRSYTAKDCTLLMSDNALLNMLQFDVPTGRHLFSASLNGRGPSEVWWMYSISSGYNNVV